MTPRKLPGMDDTSNLETARYRAHSARLDEHHGILDQHGEHLVRLDGRADGLSDEDARLRKDLSVLADALRRIQSSEQVEPQRDWLAVTDPDLAEAWLIDVTSWWDRVGSWIGPSAPACWPWHPQAVVRALAYQAAYVAAYAAGDKPMTVIDLLGGAPAKQVLWAVRGGGDCSSTKHMVGSVYYTVDLAAIPDLARWWALQRAGGDEEHPPGLTWVSKAA